MQEKQSKREEEAWIKGVLWEPDFNRDVIGRRNVPKGSCEVCQQRSQVGGGETLWFLISKQGEPGIVVHTCNPSNS